MPKFNFYPRFCLHFILKFCIRKPSVTFEFVSGWDVTLLFSYIRRLCIRVSCSKEKNNILFKTMAKCFFQNCFYYLLPSFNVSYIHVYNLFLSRTFLSFIFSGICYYFASFYCIYYIEVIESFSAFSYFRLRSRGVVQKTRAQNLKKSDIQF